MANPPSARPLRLPLHIPVAVLFSLLILGVGATISLYHYHATRLLLEVANERLFQKLADDARTALTKANARCGGRSSCFPPPRSPTRPGATSASASCPNWRGCCRQTR